MSDAKFASKIFADLCTKFSAISPQLNWLNVVEMSVHQFASKFLSPEEMKVLIERIKQASEELNSVDHSSTFEIGPFFHWKMANVESDGEILRKSKNTGQDFNALAMFLQRFRPCDLTLRLKMLESDKFVQYLAEIANFNGENDEIFDKNWINSNGKAGEFLKIRLVTLKGLLRKTINDAKPNSILKLKSEFKMSPQLNWHMVKWEKGAWAIVIQ